MTELPATIAYYSMEIAIDDRLPTFSGGLGVLAGDHLRAAADAGLPIVGVTLLYRHGFFRQAIDADGKQLERAAAWRPADLLEEVPLRVPVVIGGHEVTVRPWRFVIEGVAGHHVPVYLLDTALAENRPRDRTIADRLYLGDRERRLAQEAVLGIGGPLVLAALGHHDIAVHHMNEGHASLVPVALLGGAGTAAGGGAGTAPDTAVPGGRLAEVTVEDVEDVRRRCVFTTHTPVPAGHDRFKRDVVAKVLGRGAVTGLERLRCLEGDGSLNMTVLGMSLSRFVNGVSQRHREVTEAMFPGSHIEAVTNGVHTGYWAAPAMASLFDRRLPGWRRDSAMLRYARTVPLAELREAHADAKRALLEEVRRRSGVSLDPKAMTVGVARRFAAYKRNDLLLSDPDRLRSIAHSAGQLQVLYSGKAHPDDDDAKEMIRRVGEVAAGLAGDVPIVFLADYDMTLARLLCAGSDVWLNTPEAPNEASGTSGMKAALNGVPSLSTVDGWWVEGHLEGVTGWAVGGTDGSHHDRPADAEDLYRLLEAVVLPCYHQDPDAFTAVGRDAISFNGSFFSAQRMVAEYAQRAYGRP